MAYTWEIYHRGKCFLDNALLSTTAYNSGESTGTSLGLTEERYAKIILFLNQKTSALTIFACYAAGLLYSALAFSQEDDDLKNNTSVVLLLEWRGRRLLFTGDAEWDGRVSSKASATAHGMYVE